MKKSWHFMNLPLVLVVLVLIANMGICETIHGEWGEWGCWESECSHTCGRGTRIRRRHCDNPAPSEGGHDCRGTADDIQTCNEHPCPEAGNWGVWLEWFSCSTSCGAGTRTRVRQCINPEPKNGGEFCPGDNRDTEDCDVGPCPVHGSWGPWGEYGRCSTTCGPGVKTSTRQCQEPRHGGDPCIGSYSRTQHCNLRTCPVNGQWSAWSQWSACSVTCGEGFRTRNHSCTNPPPESGGRPCPGEDQQRAPCMSATRHCPVNGGWTDWIVITPCRGCSGTMIRTRRCTNPRPQHRGAPCQGRMNERVPCQNTEACQRG